MTGKMYQYPSNKLPVTDDGFGLVEVMVSMAILTITAVGVGYALVSSNQQINTVEYASQNQQYGMMQSTAQTGSTVCTGVQSTCPFITVEIIYAATSSTKSVQLKYISSPFQQLPSNQQPPVWWQP
jgi:prepilin-type N-terminal cleavage/methylation domain-containing protein